MDAWHGQIAHRIYQAAELPRFEIGSRMHTTGWSQCMAASSCCILLKVSNILCYTLWCVTARCGRVSVYEHQQAGTEVHSVVRRRWISIYWSENNPRKNSVQVHRHFADELPHPRISLSYTGEKFFLTASLTNLLKPALPISIHVRIWQGSEADADNSCTCAWTADSLQRRRTSLR